MAEGSPESKNTRSKNGRYPLVNHAKGSNQASFNLTKETVFLWRRALLVRYYKILDKEENTKVKWYDYDRNSKQITISDEKSPFSWKPPHKDMFKTMIHVIVDKEKLFAITLFYTTYKFLIQGNSIEMWLKTEFKNITDCVTKIRENYSKGDKSKPIDDLFANKEFPKEMSVSEETNQETDNSCIIDKEEECIMAEKSKDKNTKEKQTAKIELGNTVHRVIENPTLNETVEVLHKKIDNQKEEIDALKATLHNIEKKNR